MSDALQHLMVKANEQYEALQQKMQETVVEASAGEGDVTVTMDGRKQLRTIWINPEVIDTDVETLKCIILAAVNEAARKVDEVMQSSVSGLLSEAAVQ